jgi:hypothetical protein
MRAALCLASESRKRANLGATTMVETRKGSKRRPRPKAANPQGTPEDHPVEQDPAVERGERIQTGKAIARGGKDEGFVAGATEQPVEPKKD